MPWHLQTLSHSCVLKKNTKGGGKNLRERGVLSCLSWRRQQGLEKNGSISIFQEPFLSERLACSNMSSVGQQRRDEYVCCASSWACQNAASSRSPTSRFPARNIDYTCRGYTNTPSPCSTVSASTTTITFRSAPSHSTATANTLYCPLKCSTEKGKSVCILLIRLSPQTDQEMLWLS